MALIECPSGLTFKARKLRGKEANLFTDRKVVRSGALIGNILNAVCEEVVEAGPYEINDSGMPPWGKMLSGDRIVALIQIRVATYDSEMPFKHQCTDEMCRRRFNIDLDLIDDLVVKLLSDEDREAFLSGNKLPTWIEDPKADNNRRDVTFHLMTAQDEKKLARVSDRSPNQQITASLAQRINQIDGIHANDLIRHLDDTDLGSLQDLVARMDDHDCGIDTDFEAECSHCGHFMEVAVPLGGREFFLPQRKREVPAA